LWQPARSIKAGGSRSKEAARKLFMSLSPNVRPGFWESHLWRFTFKLTDD